MSLEARLTALAQAIATDIKAILNSRGNLAALATTDKTSLVNAINELKAAIDAADIDDTAGVGNTTSTWSADKITAALAALKSQLLGSADAAHDTLGELQGALSDADTALEGLLSAIGNRLRFDAPQSLTTAEKLQACTNIGVGNPDYDYLAAYNAAKV